MMRERRRRFKFWPTRRLVHPELISGLAARSASRVMPLALAMLTHISPLWTVWVRPPGVGADVAGGVDAEVAGGVDTDLAGGVDTDVARGVDADLAGGVDADLAGGVDAHVAGGVGAYVAGGVSGSGVGITGTQTGWAVG